MKNTLCFYMGYTPSFNGQNYKTQKYMVVKLLLLN